VIIDVLEHPSLVELLPYGLNTKYKISFGENLNFIHHVLKNSDFSQS
jgi:hypothetical protein